ncbi:hypothetical protein ACBP97_15860 [Niallia circulans]
MSYTRKIVVMTLLRPLSIAKLTTQLKGKVPFSSVERFLNYSLAIDGEPIPTLIEEKEVDKKQK